MPDKLLVISLLVIFMFTGCDVQFNEISSGVFVRKYSRNGNTYERIELGNSGKYEQAFYEDGVKVFSNGGKWKFVPSNSSHTAKWRAGTSIITFSDWISAEELLRMRELGEPKPADSLPKVDVVVVVRDRDRFAFDEDGGSDYKRSIKNE